VNGDTKFGARTEIWSHFHFIRICHVATLSFPHLFKVFVLASALK
jgi:hypothetical protein